MSMISQGPPIMPVVAILVIANVFQFVAFGDDLIASPESSGEDDEVTSGTSCLGTASNPDEEGAGVVKEAAKQTAFFFISPVLYGAFQFGKSLFDNPDDEEDTRFGIFSCIGTLWAMLGSAMGTVFNFATFNVPGAPTWLRAAVGIMTATATTFIALPVLIDLGKILADLVPFT